ncbi:glycoside hydrolase family 95 protein [Pholiota conissans]|uniref:Glycoside hydrolase family 95 protein n=1 Tax=Pholiota conissans TaxID=109636 RepID=A0A9P5Z4X1_9AGAR|nr:glycoside hydrolase family 95 protein [Pholiota conissans]
MENATFNMHFELCLPSRKLWSNMQRTVRTFQLLLLLFHRASVIAAAPASFPKSGNGLWYTQPGDVWSREWLPVGNGYLGAMVPGNTVQETTQLNIESLWAGGPFADPTYNGGNKQPSEREATAQSMQEIRAAIFQSPTGDIDNIIEQLGTDAGQYGSYAGAGNLLSTLGLTGTATNYGRWLDLDQGLAQTTWTQNGTDFLRTTFCSNPTRACIEHISTTNSRPLPDLTYAFSIALESGLPAPNITCQSKNTLLVRGFVSTSPPGMAYALLFRAFSTSPSAQFQCIQQPVPSGFPPNATIHLPVTAGAQVHDAWIAWVGDTEYDMNAGDAAHNFTFRGTDPVVKLQQLPSSPLSDYSTLLAQHTSDLKSVLSSFALDLGQTPDLTKSTDVLKAAYTVDGPASTNAYLDWVLFNYGRYMLASSSRGVLPANLQGKWGNGASNAWGSDYHADVNLQMSYWIAEVTGLSQTTPPLFDYIEKTWAPRGAYTALVLYNITRGWVTHDEMNVFGHTGMKATLAEWSDYPEASVWMMLHVWDHFDFTNDVDWWKRQGWPLIKGAASFHLEKLMPDLHFNDSTLVVNPCNSPEQAPITFGCAHSQQVIWQLFNAVEKGFAASGDDDNDFLTEVLTKRAQMDKGLRIGSWGQLQEWKFDQDSPTDTHRHLSHLVGLYPGYAVSNFDPQVQGTGAAKAYSKNQVLDAAKVSLIHRGNGTGPDADAGWEKAWRAAAWAQFGNSSMFYHELSFAMNENFGPNLFSLYNPGDPNPIFQIDANFGIPAAVMNGLLQAPDVASVSTPLIVTLLPALPAQWASGSIRGARVRGGITVDVKWSKGKLTEATFTVDAAQNIRQRPVEVIYASRVLGSFTTSSGLKKVFTVTRS